MLKKDPLKDFSGLLPLFPLPNVVLFPSTMLPLHIFERRYRIMLNHALEGDGLIGMSILKPGWEEKYEGNPAIYPVACLGTIINHEPLEDGRSNILLLGIKRVKILDIITPRPYRTARVEILNDAADDLTEQNQQHLKQILMDLYGELVIEYAGSHLKFPTLSNTDMPLGQLSDALAAGIGLPVEERVRMLKEVRIGERARFVIEQLEAMLKKGGPSIIPGNVSPSFRYPINLN